MLLNVSPSVEQILFNLTDEIAPLTYRPKAQTGSSLADHETLSLFVQGFFKEPQYV